MAFKRHKHPAQIKSLLHFDYDYPDSIAAAATSIGCGGLRDEIGLSTWNMTGTCRMVGAEAPAVVVDGTPKFGWRCVQFGGASDYISTGNPTGVWSLRADGRYEMDFFMRPTTNVAGNLINLRGDGGDVLTLSLNASGNLVLLCTAWNILNVTSTAAVTLNVFSFVTLRVSGGTATVYVDGTQFITAEISGDNLSVTEVRLGGYVGQMDEFRFSQGTSTRTPVIPTTPQAGYFDLSSISGYGNGSHGDASLTTSGNVQINTYAPVTALSANSLTIGTMSNGIYGAISPGDEVMIHLSYKRGTEESELGFYAIRRVLSQSGNIMTFTKPIADEFDAATAAQKYVVQVVSVPNFKSLNISANTVIVPKLWDGSIGGIVAFKAQEDCAINGKILTEATGPRRMDNLALVHADIAEQFILTGNVFIACGGILSTSDDVRIGANHPGDVKGVVGFGSDGEGAGGNYSWGGKPGREGKGGYGPCGGGGGGGCRGDGGNGLSYNGTYDPTSQDGKEGYSAPNVILIAKQMRISATSISTGGSGGGGGGGGSDYNYTDGRGGGGGGSGGASGGVVVDKAGSKGSGIGNFDLSTGGSKGSDTGKGGDGGKGYFFFGGSAGMYGSLSGGAGGEGYGAGYGGVGGAQGDDRGADGGNGGGGAGTGFCYLSYEEVI